MYEPHEYRRVTVTTNELTEVGWVRVPGYVPHAEPGVVASIERTAVIRSLIKILRQGVGRASQLVGMGLPSIVQMAASTSLVSAVPAFGEVLSPKWVVLRTETVRRPDLSV
jgi:hypothetical protein